MLTLPVILTLFNFPVWCISMLALLISINIFQIFGLKLKIQTNENLTGCWYFRRRHMITRVFKILTWIHHISLIVLKYAHAHLIIHKARTTYVTLDEKNNNIINCD